MSPEQARGKALDKRTDIWAFGCVLYEMLTGRRAFRGETFSDTIAAILEREPDWTALPPATPPAALRLLLRRCLEKDPSGASVTSAMRGTGWRPSQRVRLTLARLALHIPGGALPGCSAVSRWRRPASRAGCSGSRRRRRPRAVCNSNVSPISSGWRSRRPFRRTARGSRSWPEPAASVRFGNGCWPEAHPCKSPVTISTTSSRAGPRIRAPSSTLCRRPHQGSTARSGRSPSIGGEPRRVAAALGGGDISHDGRRIALFRFEDKGIALVLVTRDGSGADEVKPCLPIATTTIRAGRRMIAGSRFNKTISTGFNKRRFRRLCRAWW